MTPVNSCSNYLVQRIGILKGDILVVPQQIVAQGSINVSRLCRIDSDDENTEQFVLREDELIDDSPE